MNKNFLILISFVIIFSACFAEDSLGLSKEPEELFMPSEEISASSIRFEEEVTETEAMEAEPAESPAESLEESPAESPAESLEESSAESLEESSAESLEESSEESSEEVAELDLDSETKLSSAEKYYLFDPFNKLPLSAIEENYTQFVELSKEVRNYYRLARALVAASSEDRHFRRANEFLSRKISFSFVPTMASMLFLPEMLFVSSKMSDNYLASITSDSDFELADEKETRGEKINFLFLQLETMYKQLEYMLTLDKQIDGFIELVNADNILSSGELTSLLLNRNKRIVQKILFQQEKMRTYIEHYKSLIISFEERLKYLEVNLDSFFQPEYMGNIVKIRRFFINFEMIHKKYVDSFTLCLENELSESLQEWERLEEQALKHQYNTHHVLYYLNDYPQRDRHEMTGQKFVFFNNFLDLFFEVLSNSSLLQNNVEYFDFFNDLETKILFLQESQKDCK